jgi:serine/threonine-protein kinase Stk1
MTTALTTVVCADWANAAAPPPFPAGKAALAPAPDNRRSTPAIEPDIVPPIAPEPALPSPDRREARFLPEALLGAGGLCEVYAALDLRRVEWGDASPRVALKRLKPELKDNHQARLLLVQEFCVLRHLAHPGVVRVFDLHKEPAGMCLSMELLAGRSLQEELARQPVGLGKDAAPVAEALFDTLDFLHRHGIAHGDVKPANLFLEPDGRVTLIDFNVATATAKAGAAESPVTLGLRESLRLPSYSLLYAAPERLEGGGPSPADDVFAACCAVYEAAGGAHPFGQRSALEARGGDNQPERPWPLARNQWNALRKGLSFDPARRPTALDLRQAFRQPERSLPFLGVLRR